MKEVENRVIMNIGIVLSGGMAKGAYQIGALKAVNEFVPLNEIKHISAASVGVLNGYAFATEQLDVAEKMWHNVCNEDLRLLINQILKSSMLQQDIINLYNHNSKFSSEFYCALYNSVEKNIVYKNLQSENELNIPLYLKASVAMPIYNRAVKIDNGAYYDGAMIDNIPVFPLVKQELDYVICIYFDDNCYKFESTVFDNKIIKITFPGTSLLKQSLIFTQADIDNMITDGFETSIEVLNKIFKNGYDDLEYIQNCITEQNSNTSHRLRITGDVLVSNLNRLTQKFTKRKIII